MLNMLNQNRKSRNKKQKKKERKAAQKKQINNETIKAKQRSIKVHKLCEDQTNSQVCFR